MYIRLLILLIAASLLPLQASDPVKYLEKAAACM
jgi:hypothetical protein